MTTGDVSAIMLSSSLLRSPVRLRCWLAHELGHHFTGAFGSSDRDEARANKWAAELLLPDEWLEKRKGWEPWDIADEAGVYQWLVEERLEAYARRAGQKGVVRDVKECRAGVGACPCHNSDYRG